MPYNLEIETSIANGIFADNDIYTYPQTPYEQQFESFYTFCRENLNINSEKYDLNPNVFVFLNNVSVNAKAGRKNNFFVIAINSGLMVDSIHNILMNENYHHFVRQKFSDLLKFYDNSLDVLSFQLSTQFTFYHELAHLIQFRNIGIAELIKSERMDDVGNFNLTQHWLEMNADTFSSISIGAHIQQYLFQQIGTELTQENATESLIIFGTSLLTYLMSFGSAAEGLYLFEHSHPHPIIRITNILMTTVHYLNQSPKFEQLKISFSYNEIFQKVTDLYIDLEKNKITNSSISEHLVQSLKKIPEIIEYNKAIRAFQTDAFNDAVAEWNKNVK